jgi:hypothetical protein
LENAEAVGEDQMLHELGAILASARRREMEPSDFAARLESLHARFLGANANTPDMVRRRCVVAKAYDDLIAGADMDRHHHLELLAQALGLDVPHAP